MNATRYRPGQAAGHYESFFQRANHPTRPLAFWIRYTLFSPRQHPEDAVGELWAIYFDGERKQHVALRQAEPLEHCVFDQSKLSVQVAGSRLEPGQLIGQCASGGHTITWDLAFEGGQQPLFLLPLPLYAARLPRAKSMVDLPLAVFDGRLTVDGGEIPIGQWVGSQNHNWGSQHTDTYAWGQVAGFDTHPASFLEVASARLKFGPLWTPFLTPMVLRHNGEEVALNGIAQSLRARASLTYFEWTFRAETDAVRLEGTIAAPRDAFVGLRYANPPGGWKQCLNSKIASCTLKLTSKGRHPKPTVELLSTAHRAAFEILTDDQQHGIPISAG